MHSLSRGLRRVGVGLLGLGLVLACGPESASPDGSPPAAATTDAGLCADHGVLQSVCTQCNPRLAAVFQAKGDWCDEHGFPESFCPTCSPEAGGRPAVAPSPTDGAPADGTRVRFKTRAAAAQAGLELAPAEASDWVDGTEVVAALRWDATRTAAVSAPAQGVVHAIQAEVGDSVAEGQAVAVLRSPAAASLRARLAAAQRTREAAAETLSRQAGLEGSGVAARRAVQEAETTLAAAKAEQQALAAELALVGRGARDAVILRAPVSGVITARHAQVGQAVDGLAPLFELADPAHLWAMLEVPERALPAVSAGNPVQIRLHALPEEIFEGTIAAIAPGIDPHTRTAPARVVLANADGRLRAGFMGTATILGTTARAATVVPESAVQRAGTVHLVFVREADDSYIARRVRVLARQGDRVRVAGGVRPGDAVVTTGSFLLKTETLKDSIGAGCCDVD